MDEKTTRILGLSDDEVHAEHLARYDGNQALADKSIDMARARLHNLLAKHWKQ